MKHYNIFHMRRAGGHAFIEWLASDYQHTLHYNDCFEWETTANCWVIKNYGSDIKNIDCTIHSYEDFEPTIQELEQPNTFIILRDWFNMCASRIVSNRGAGKTARQRFVSERTRECEEVFLQYMSLYQRMPERFIIYNSWVANESYRAEVAKRLDLRAPWFTYEMPKSKIGNGSSFSTNINADEVNSRYLKLPHQDLEYLTRNQEINTFCKEVFGIVL